MRKSLLATALSCSFAFSGAALAQTPAPPAAAAPAAATPAPPEAAPAPAPEKKPMMMKKAWTASGSASNITASTVKSDIAPKLPTPKLGPDAGPADYLKAAKAALKAHNTGEAQEALEMAETRALDRSTAVDTAGTPDSDPLISNIHTALDALAKKDWKGTDSAIDAAVAGAPPDAKPMTKPMPKKMMKKVWKKKDAATPAPAAPPK